MSAWATLQDPDTLLALMLVHVAGVGGVPEFAPWFPEIDRYIQRLVDVGAVDESGDATLFGQAILFGHYKGYTSGTHTPTELLARSLERSDEDGR